MSEFDTHRAPYHRRWRRMSEFLCREMMYDYLTGRLDEDRQEAVSNFLLVSREAREDKQDLEYGLQYCELLAQSDLAPALLKKLQARNSVQAPAKTYFYWRNWPAPVRWTMESVIIASVVAFMISMVPWHQLQLIIPVDRSQQILAQIGEKFSQQKERIFGGTEISMPIDSGEESTASHPPIEGAPEEGLAPGQETGEVTSTAVAQADSAIHALSPTDQGEESPLPPGMDIPVEVTAQASPTSSTVAAVTSRATEAAEAAPALRGYLYRAYMNLPSVDEVSGEMANVIRGLGGEKAGTVELGWRKPNGSYYHFTLPESNYQKLETALKTYGPVRIYKERHKRVMPQGEIRLILWVEESRVKIQAPNEVSIPQSTDESGGGRSDSSGANEAPTIETTP